ncbi:MAG TPA: esterase [Microscillaceae bacterium]|nr:esterase [Microscillaceae bacterium]
MKAIIFHLTLLFLRLKGYKKMFSHDPMLYEAFRKDDVFEAPKKLLKAFQVRNFQVAESKVTEVLPKNGSSDYLVLFIHGGAMVAGPGKHHWDSMGYMVKKTGVKFWLMNYPKAPEHKITQIAQNVDAVYAEARKTHAPSQIFLMGDSAGGNLILTLTQRLIKNGEEPPKAIIPITPAVDVTFTNEAIDLLDSRDPILSKKGVTSTAHMSSGGVDLADPMMSPINGSFEKFPKTLMFLAGRDILYPDAKVAAYEMKKAGVPLEVVEETRMIHIWPLMPVMREAKAALNKICDFIRQNSR